MILDANILIAVLDPADALHRRAADLVVRSAGVPLRAAELTIAECLVTPARAGLEDRAASRLRVIGVRPLTLKECSVDLARIRAATGLKMPDAAVLLAAERTGDHLATFDTRLGRAARDRGVVVAE